MTDKAIVKTTCPRDCYDACGIHVIVREGRVNKVLGDESHHVSRGALCGKCALAYNGAFIDPQHRLQSPLKRVGKKGLGQFVETTWEDALSEIASRLKDIVQTQSSEAIYHTHYTGTVSMLAGWFPLRFFQRLGATEVDPDTVCNKAGHVALEAMFGSSLAGFDPRQLEHAKSLLIWGANPSHSAPHMHKDWVFSSGTTKVVVIDPIKTDTAEKADIHLQPRPGSDSALAFGLLHVMQNAGMFDEGFLSAHVHGFDAVRQHIAEATLERTEALTGCSSAEITEVAHLFGAGPSLLWLGQGMQRQPQGGNAFRSAVLLPIATGYLGQPGAGFCYMNGPETRGIDMDFIARPDPRVSSGPSVSHVDLAGLLSDASKCSALLTWNNNILASSPDQAQLRRALEREDLLTVVTDLFMTDTAAYADYILPAASFLEFNDVVIPYFHDTISAQVKAADPLGHSLSNQEIFRRLAKAMDFEEGWLYESDDEVLEQLLSQTPLSGDFEALKRAGTVQLNDRPRIQFEDKRFSTPSAKIEVTCETLQAEGVPDAPFPHADEAPSLGTLRVLSPASRWLMNSSYGNDDRILTKLSDASGLFNPCDLRDRGIEAGVEVQLRNDTGALTLRAIASDLVKPGVVVVYKGRWPRHSGGYTNVNVLNKGLKTDLAESSAVHGVEAEVVKL